MTGLRHNRDFVLLWTGQAVSTLGSRLSGFAYPLLVLALTGSAAQAGFVGFAQQLPNVVLQLPAGALIDRLDRRSVMVAADLVRAVAVGTVAVAVLLDATSLGLLLGAAFVEGCGLVFFFTAEAGAVRSVVPREQLQQAISANQARGYGIGLAGQPLAGVLYQAGRAIPFAVDAMSYLVSALTLRSLRTPLRPRQNAASLRELPREIAEGVRFLRRQRFLLGATLLAAASNLLGPALTLLLIVRAQEGGATPAVIGVMFAGSAVGGLVGAVLAPRTGRRIGVRGAVFVATWGWTLTTLAVAATTSAAVLAAILCVNAMLSPIWNVVVGAYATALTPDELMGRVTAAENVVCLSTAPIGSLAAGLLIAHGGATKASLMFAAFMLLVAVLATATPARRAFAAEEVLG